MGTVILANSNIQTLNIRAIVGSFFVILLILAFYNLFKSNKSVKLATFLTIIVVITISSLILLTSAVSYMVNIDVFGAMI